jgi:hypothetical protein
VRWSSKDFNKLLAAGKIKSWKENKRSDPKPSGRIVAKVFKKRSKEKEDMEGVLLAWCNANGCKLNGEYYFAKPRKFRFDWAIPDKMVAIEYEGLFSKKSRHTTWLYSSAGRCTGILLSLTKTF